MDIPSTTKSCRLCNGEVMAPWPPAVDKGPTHHTCHPGEELKTLLDAKRKEIEEKGVLLSQLRDQQDDLLERINTLRMNIMRESVDVEAEEEEAKIRLLKDRLFCGKLRLSDPDALLLWNKWVAVPMEVVQDTDRLRATASRAEKFAQYVLPAEEKESPECP